MIVSNSINLEFFFKKIYVHTIRVYQYYVTIYLNLLQLGFFFYGKILWKDGILRDICMYNMLVESISEEFKLFYRYRVPVSYSMGTLANIFCYLIFSCVTLQSTIIMKSLVWNKKNIFFMFKYQIFDIYFYDQYFFS